MRPTRLRVLGALLLGGLCASASATDNLEAWLRSTVDDGEALSAVATTHRDGKSATFAFGVRRPDGEAPDSETQYEIGSITKVFTHMLLAEMVAAKSVSYDTTLGELLGEALSPRNPAVRDITLFELATHTSGLPRLPGNLAPSDPGDPYAGYDADSLLQAINSVRDKQPLLKRYAYSNFGVGLLGYVLGQVDGEGYARALERHVLKPMALASAGFEFGDNHAEGYRGGAVVPNWNFTDALVAAGGLRASAGDLSRLAALLRNGDEWPLEQSLADALDTRVTTNGEFDLTPVWHVAYADEAPIFWHNGGTGGYLSFFGFRPDTGDSIAILVAGGAAPTPVGLRWLGQTASDAKPETVDTSIVGQYQFNSAVGIGVFDSGDGLVAQVTGQVPTPLTAGVDDWYALSAVDASLQFIREAQTVVAVELVQNGIVQRAKKTSDTPAGNDRESIALLPEALADFVGEYAINPSVKFSITRKDDRLFARLTGQDAYPIYAEGDDVFFYKVVDAELRFERDGDGKVVALTLHQGALRQRAERVDAP